jgi:UDP-N-acetylmuramoylalanine--D-glutamate ligase
VLLNLSDNHLDWHGSFDAYARAKLRVFENQEPTDYAVLNADDAESIRRTESIRSQKMYFSACETENPNYAACLAVSGLFSLDESRTRRLLREFRGLEHRLEEVPSADGVRYVNDSKSTTIASLRWALSRIPEPVILVMGGRHKGGDFGAIRDLVARKVRFLIAIGEASRLIDKTFVGVVSGTCAPSLEDALRYARAVARRGDTVLFSPACASFDMFKNYEERGRRFKQLIADGAGAHLLAPYPDL